jgi:hypothetical protein
MIATTNNDDKGNDDMTCKVVRTGKLNTLLRKAKHYEQGQTNITDREKVKRKNVSEQDDGGFKAQIHSGTEIHSSTVEVLPLTCASVFTNLSRRHNQWIRAFES